jgi:hypothetical protein
MATSPQPGRLAPIVGAAVIFSDRDGEPWQVTELDCGQVPGARGARCLVFMSDSVMRRVWSYPTAWRRLDVAELMEVSWRR